MLKDSQLDLCGRVDFARTTPLLARDEAFSFAYPIRFPPTAIAGVMFRPCDAQIR